MAKKLISDLKVGEPVDEVFLLGRCDLKTSKNESLYLDLLLSDRSGAVGGRMWDASQALYESLEVDDFVRVKGRMGAFQNRPQIRVNSISKADISSLRLGDFLPQAETPPEKMMDEVKSILDQIEDPDYRRICEAFLGDQDFTAAFRTAPAAVRYHHAYLGGLLEHTLNVLRLADTILPQYPFLRRDLLLTAAFLHDVGKTAEIGYKRTFSYTDSGQLVGHLVLGVVMLENKASKLELPDDKLALLRHCILSHHGQYEYGSPKLPMTAEALALHYLDNLDAKLTDFEGHLDTDQVSNSNWTGFLPQFGRRLFRK